MLRVTLGITVGMQAACYLTGAGVESRGWLALGILLGADGLALLAGFLTPAAGVVAMLIAGGSAGSWLPLPDHNLLDSKLSAMLSACIAAALLFLGPGALSVDAKRFGRREIIIPPSPRAQSPGS